MPPTYVVDVQLGYGRGKTLFDVARQRLVRAPHTANYFSGAGANCALM